MAEVVFHPPTERLLSCLARISPGERGEIALPFVTVTYAQSIDGSIAAERGTPLPLSGHESMRLTHALRVRHDAILVGVGTLMADNPSLTARLVEGPNPQPVILDSSLRTPLSCKLLTAEACRPPILCTRLPSGDDDAEAWQRRRCALEAAGATVIECGATASGRVDLDSAMRRLPGLGLRSVMVEGGASVLTSFVSQAATHLLGAVLVTVAPMFVGGLQAVSQVVSLEGGGSPAYARLSVQQVELLGGDICFVAIPPPAAGPSAGPAELTGTRPTPDRAVVEPDPRLRKLLTDAAALWDVVSQVLPGSVDLAAEIESCREEILLRYADGDRPPPDDRDGCRPLNQVRHTLSIAD